MSRREGPVSPGDDNSFQSEVRAVVGELRRTIRAALGESETDPARAPAELSRDLGLDTKLGWKLHWLLSNTDPFSAALFVPGRGVSASSRPGWPGPGRTRPWCGRSRRRARRSTGA